MLFEVALDDGSEQAWLGVFEKLAAAERLCALRFLLSDIWHHDIVSPEAVNVQVISEVKADVSTRRWSPMFGYITFTNRCELLERLPRFVGSDHGRGTRGAVMDIDSDLEDGS